MHSSTNISPVSTLLGGIAIGAAQKLDLVVSAIGVTPVPSAGGKAQRNGTIFVQDSASLMGGPETDQTAIGADYPLLEQAAKSTVTYRLEEYKRAAFVAEAHERYSEVPGSLVQESAAFIGRYLALKLEARVASLFFSTGNWPDAALVDIGGGGVQWSTYSTAKPDNDLDALRVLAREQGYGAEPDTLIIGQQAFDAYRRCIQSQGIAVVTSGAARGDILTREAAIQRIESIHGVRCIVGSARHNTAAPGLATSGAYIWGKSMWMGTLGGGIGTQTDSGMVLTPRAAVVLADTMGSPLNLSGITLPMSGGQVLQVPPKAKGTIVHAECYTDEIVCDTNLGYLVTSVAA